jgi:hypothetical protein
MKIRQEVQMFEPLPSHLAYPDILEEYATSGTAASSANPSVPAGATAGPIGDLYQTWYPPMRNTLSLLSKLYGVVELPVFEDFARRAIDLCVAALRKGSEGIKRIRPGLHGDLFLVRHLLMLREQLSPFELRMTSTEKALDFTSTGEALQSLIGECARLCLCEFNWACGL